MLYFYEMKARRFFMESKKCITKRIVAWVLCLAMIITTINISAFATDTKAAANITFYVDSIEYEVTSGADATVKVIGSDKATIGNKLIIPDEVTYDGVTYKVTEIAARAFVNANNAYDFTGDLVIGDNVTTIGDAAFSYNGFTGALKLGKSVAYIGQEAFLRCKFADELVIPANVKEIKTGAFAYWDNLKKVTIKSDRTVIQQNAFVYDNIDTVKLAGTAGIDSGTFYTAKIEKVVIPYGMDESELERLQIVRDIEYDANSKPIVHMDYAIERYYAPEDVTVLVYDYDSFCEAVTNPISENCTIVFDTNIIANPAFETINIASKASAKNIVIDMNGYDLITAENSTGVLFKLSNAVNLRVINSNQNNESTILMYNSGKEEAAELVMFDLENSDATVDMYNVECILASDVMNFEPTSSEQKAQIFNVVKGNVIIRGGSFENYFSKGHVINDLTSDYQNNILITGGAQLISANAPIVIGKTAPYVQIYDASLKVVGNYYDDARIYDDTDNIQIKHIVGKNMVNSDTYSSAFDSKGVLAPTKFVGYLNGSDLEFVSGSSKESRVQDEFVTGQCHIWIDSETLGCIAVAEHIIVDNSSPATCIKDGHMGRTVCSVCGLIYCEYEYMPAHNSLTWIETIEPTCVKYGVAGHYECSCGKWYVDENCQLEIEDHDTWPLLFGSILPTGNHTYVVEGSTKTCSVCGLTDIVKNGFKYDMWGDNWFVFVNDEVDTSVTDIIYYSGVWYYVQEGALNKEYAGLVDHNGTLWYVSNGKLDKTFNGFVTYSGKSYLVKNGTVDTTATGFKYAGEKWGKVVKGVVDDAYTGLYYYNNDWWYLTNGFLDKAFKGVTEKNGSLWFIRNGKIARENGITKFDGSIYWITNGAVDTSATKLFYFSGDSTWYYFRKGVVDWSYNTLAYANNAWWYINDGVLDKTYTGLVLFRNQLWYVTDGLLDKTYAGTCEYQGKTYKVTEGIGTEVK